ncbi:hypothetical protein N7474_010690 [Penicillium riverlandense]|uniref:uncharacterized protein n=1 Tax=Penicillium riverlandense TaxID=1903569 RepID=UPI002546C0A4|nr:uncharacterized protein N7474_010712 [Penicillium riverlandense]XP_057048371.1 uncharacterized protein N7474_010690 [Penicillium riverlandense]KAJ5804825.1 hypothetical protein N7474_010712 [Penicillium riverlandense]KAJ5807098.1 hypothetical protein N7474_010690 [Penicillium riverlandense]
MGGLESGQADEYFELIRPAGVIESIYKIHHGLGVLSNTIVCATYERTDNIHLTPGILYAALPLVVSEHPALATIIVDQPSKKKIGGKRAWQARLRKICVKDCVRFVDNAAEQEQFIRLLQEEHDIWFKTEDRAKPLWRVVVNVTQEQQETGQDKSISTDIDVAKHEMKPESMALLQALGMRFSICIGLLSYLSSFMVKFFLRSSYTFFSDVMFKEGLPSKDSPVPLAKRPVTKLERMCLNPSQLAATLKACRKHNTSITTLIETLIHVTLASDVYPAAKVGLSYLAVDLRRFLPTEFSNTMGNYVSSHQTIHWLCNYRRAGVTSPANDRQIALMWELSQRAKADLDSAMFRHQTPRPVANALGLTAIGEDDESIMAGIYKILDVAVTKTFCVSSLVESKSQSSGPWQLKSAEFSVSAQKSQVGPMLYFAMASMRDDQCVINVSHEEGVLQTGVVRKILEGVESRLIMLLEAENGT